MPKCETCQRQVFKEWRVQIRARTEPSLFRLFKRERVDVEVGLLVVVLAAVDELYHLLVGAVSLLYARLAHPFPDGILDGVIDIVKRLAEGLAVRADAALLGEVVTFIVDVIDLTPTLATSILSKVVSYPKFYDKLVCNSQIIKITFDNKL